MTQRYYQPAAGRFTQFDPLPESVMLPNRYEYAECNPSNYVDPSGLAVCTPRQAVRDTIVGVATVVASVGVILGLGAVTGGGAAVAAAIGAQAFIFAGVYTATYCYGNTP